MTAVAERLAHRGRASEIYQAHDGGRMVALKVVPAAHGAALERESAVLEQLAGAGAPLPLGIEPVGGERLQLRATWVAGVHATRAAAELRGAAGPRSPGLLELCGAVLDAYAALHARGVLHGQPHPRHVLVDGAGAVTLVDFAGAVAPGARGAGGRGALNALLAPEDARARPAGAEPTDRREQYSLAALVYLLLTGRVHLDLARDAPSALRQIASPEPLSFRRRGCEPWPEVERVLERGLATRPEDRFASVGELASALRAATPPRRPRRLVEPALAQRTADLLAATDGAVPPAHGSVYSGAAGVALALDRLACVSGDAALAERAASWIGPAEFDSEGVSPFHGVSGRHYARAVVAATRGDAAGVEEAVTAFVKATSAPSASLDLTTGRAAVLLGCALLHDRAGDRTLRAHGDRIQASLWPPAEMEYLGVAHGVAGVLYATLQWARTRGAPPPADLDARLDDLAARAEAIGRGWRWPARRVPHDGEVFPYRSGWCHGGAGYVGLWTLAHEVAGDPRYLGIAERAAWGVWEEPLANGGLCCGAAGQAYALLNMYRHSGDRAWIERAASIANAAAARELPADDPARPLSLFKGDVGLALVAAELGDPANAAMPLFEHRPAATPP